jgi:hypothetical protein
MTDVEGTASPIVSRDLFPATDEKVLELIPDFAWAVARASAATVLADRVLTVAEYEAIADSATALESLSSYPGLMSYLVLRALQEEPNLNSVLKDLQKTTRELPLETRQAVFEATRGVHQPDVTGEQKIHEKWANALGVDPTIEKAVGRKQSATSVLGILGTGQNVVDSAWRRISRARLNHGTEIVERAQSMSSAFQDQELSSAISKWEASTEEDRDAELNSAIAAATDRAVTAAAARLKAPKDLEQQRELADRFLQTTEALIQQVRSRLLSVEARLRLQSEMFDEDLQAFIESSLDALEISMRDLTKGRDDWTSPAVWEAFKERAAFADLKARFTPILNRYTRLFDQWQHELESFSNEAGVIRSSIFSSVDMRAFSALVPSQHSSACFKCALDRVSDATLTFSAMGVLTAGAATAAGLVSVAAVVAALSNPVGATIGAVIGAAALWKAVAQKEARRDKLVKDKRGQIRTALRQLLKDEGLNHDQMATDVLAKFVEAAIEQYTPMVVEARLWAMKARLEGSVTQRVLGDTRSFLIGGSR